MAGRSAALHHVGLGSVLLKKACVHTCVSTCVCGEGLKPSQGQHASGCRPLNTPVSPEGSRQASSFTQLEAVAPGMHLRCLSQLWAWGGLGLGFASLSALLLLALWKVPVHFASPACFCSGPEESMCHLQDPKNIRGYFVTPPIPTPAPALACPGATALSCQEGLSAGFFFPRSPSGLCSSPGNRTSSPRALAKHAMFVLSAHRL